MITISRELIRDGIGTEVLTACLKRHDALLPDMQRLRAYYEGRNPAILERTDGERGQMRLPHPFARYIALTTAGYLTGQPIRYSAPGQEQALEALMRSFHDSAMDSVDAELAVQAAVYGKGVERIWTDRRGRVRSVSVSPEEAFVVYDDTVAHEALFGVCLSPVCRADGTEEGVQLEVLPADEILTCRLHDRRAVTDAAFVGRERHYFGQPPLIEYWNNCDETGDFAAVLPLIDGYDLLETERVRDKETFADSLLVLTGCQLEQGWHTRTVEGPDGEPVEERVPDEDPARRLRRERCLSLPDSEASAQYLTHSLHEADTEVLRAALKEDIHKFSFVPDLSDKQFAQNQSGVAMKYKLMGLERMAAVKERWFREGLRTRIAIYARMLALAGEPRLEAEKVEVRFERGKEDEE